MQLEGDAGELTHVEQRIRQREAEFEQRLDGKAVRTEALGRDRHHRSYWSLQACRTALWVETPDGERLGVLTSPQELQRLGDSLLETGSREHALSQVRLRPVLCVSPRPLAAAQAHTMSTCTGHSGDRAFRLPACLCGRTSGR